ncbi:VPS54 subunit of GARP complex scat [Rhipicephalus microplus]|uniref:VPS54 subunit of GARP complex scat n=1 Tax=Rhipicephalus microplus TaxID=6941 RepID=UPI003F6C0D44
MSDGGPRPVPWRNCQHCPKPRTFKTADEFRTHLRERHCSKEGGSFVCRYGEHDVCASLPVEGVSDEDYEAHVAKHHLRGEYCWPPDAVAEARWTVHRSAQNLPAVLNDPRRSRREVDFFTRTWGDHFTETPPAGGEGPGARITRQLFEAYLSRCARSRRPCSSSSTAAPEPAPAGSELCLPAVFLGPEMRLEEPATFAQAIPWAAGPSRLLQERLTHYLDLVEVQLARQVSLRSDAFFQAVRSHDVLAERLSTCAAVTAGLRSQLARARDQLAGGGLRLLMLWRRRARQRSLCAKLQLLATLHQAQPTIQRLLASGDFARALDFIEASREIVALELAGVQSLRHLGAQLQELERHIERMMAADLARGLSAELNRPPDDVDPVGLQEEESLTALVAGILRLNRPESADFASLLREEACTALQAAVKAALAEGMSEGEVWTALLERALDAVERVLRRSSNLARLQRYALAAQAAEGAPLEADEEVRLEQARRGALAAVAEVAQERCARLVPSDAHRSPLNTGVFPALCRRAEQCAEDWAQLCEHRSQGSLVLALRTQADRFVSRFHEEHKAKLSLLLDAEVWARVDVPAELQSMVDQFLDIPNAGMKGGGAAPHLALDGQRYCITASTLLVLRMVLEYCHCARNLPWVGLSLAAKLQELLRLFNSRTSQLVLGAGALQRVGLKTITASMLALAARCLQLIMAFLPRVKTHFEQHLVARKDTARHFDAIAKEYAEHVTEIFAKLANIVSNVLDGQLAEWEVKAPVPSPAFRAIARHLTKFHTAIAELLSPEDVSSLLQAVHSMFRSLLARHMARLSISRDGGPQHGLVTQELIFYAEHLRSLGCPVTDTSSLWQQQDEFIEAAAGPGAV